MLYCVDLFGNSSLSTRLPVESHTKQCLVVVFICVIYISCFLFPVQIKVGNIQQYYSISCILKPVYVISMAITAMFSVAVGFWDEEQILMPSFCLNEYV